MALNNVRANEPPPMSPWVQELEKTIADLRKALAQAQTQINTLNNRR